MLESMLASSGGYYPDSGPGTKYLQFGDDSFGYFGEVSEEEFITYDQVAATVTVFTTNTTVKPYLSRSPSQRIWHKFFVNGKVIYRPQYQIYYHISWEMLYQSGVLYGVDGPGSNPYPTGSSVNQLTTITGSEGDKPWAVIVRTPRHWDGIDTLPALYTTERHYSPECDTYHTIDQIVGGPWLWIGQNEFIVSPWTTGWDWVMESWDGTSGGYVAVPHTYNYSQTPKSTYANIGWRPAIELVNLSTTLLPIKIVSAEMVYPWVELTTNVSTSGYPAVVTITNASIEGGFVNLTVTPDTSSNAAYPAVVAITEGTLNASFVNLSVGVDIGTQPKLAYPTSVESDAINVNLIATLDTVEPSLIGIAGFTSDDNNFFTVEFS